jgi:hypothetical protein
VTGLLPFDLPALEQGVEKFFAELNRTGEDLSGARFLLELAPWFATGAVTIIAVELVRWRLAKQRHGLSPSSVWG